MGRRKNRNRETYKGLSNSLTIHSFADSDKVMSKIAPTWGQKIPKSFSIGALSKVTGEEEVEVDDQLEEVDENVNIPKVKGKKVKNRDPSDSQATDNSLEPCRLPYDVWELIGNYILPCCVGKFGSLCKDSYSVIQRPAFWMKLYRDYYRFDFDMPGRLQPHEVLQHTHGLRSKVIRSLYYMYKPFVVRLRRPQVMVCDPHQLKGMICQNFWHEKRGKDFHYFIKFSKLGRVQQKKLKKTASQQGSDLLTWDEAEKDFHFTQDDVDVNVDEGCRLLVLHCDAFNFVTSQIVAQKLNDICLTMSGKGFRYQKLTLSFVPAHSRSIQCSELNTVDVHNIMSMKILNWYHPLYIS